jgi:3-phenylpropionate/cinnamic acid dioxygenase small subunit
MNAVTMRQLIQYEMVSDRLNDDTALRVAELALALISWRARRQLRRRIRRGQADFAWAGPDPIARRTEAANNAWLVREQDRRAA